MKGIYFDDVHSFKDLNLVLSKVEIPPAQPKTTYIDIPGADGSLDLTEALGEVKYKDRECKFTFTMHPSGGLADEDYEDKKSEVGGLLNGRQCKIFLDKDPDYYYFGRCKIDSFASSKRIRQIVVGATVRPYKYKKYETVLTYSLTSTETEVSFMCGRKSVVPVIECTDDNTLITFGGNSHTLGAGTHKLLDIEFKHGKNQLKLSGSGTVTFRFQEGEL